MDDGPFSRVFEIKKEFCYTARRDMKKEITVAIFLGLGIGLLAVFGVITARRSLEHYRTTQNIGDASLPSPAPTSTDNPSKTQELSITTPVDGAVFGENTVVLNGMFRPKSPVVITTEENQYIKETDLNGKFEQEVSLVNGENELRTVAFSLSGERQEKTVMVVYTTAEF